MVNWRSLGVKELFHVRGSIDLLFDKTGSPLRVMHFRDHLDNSRLCFRNVGRTPSHTNHPDNIQNWTDLLLILSTTLFLRTSYHQLLNSVGCAGSVTTEILGARPSVTVITTSRSVRTMAGSTQKYFTMPPCKLRGHAGEPRLSVQTPQIVNS